MLRNYRSMPHQTIQATPTQLLMHHELPTNLQSIKEQQENDSEVQEMDRIETVRKRLH